MLLVSGLISGGHERDFGSCLMRLPRVFFTVLPLVVLCVMGQAAR